MRLEDWQYLLVLAQKQSINNAAAELKITHQSLGKAISNLEREIGVEIFKRSAKGVSLTEEGQEVVDFAEKMLEEYYDLLKRVSKSTDKEKIAGEMNIYFSLSFGISALPRLINDFKKKYPQVQTNSYTLSRRDVVKQIDADVQKNLTTIGFVNIELANKREFMQYMEKYGQTYYGIKQTEMCFFVGKNHELAGRRDVPLKEILSRPLIQLCSSPVEEIEQFKEFGKYKSSLNTSSYNIWCEVLKNSDKVGFLYDVVLPSEGLFKNSIDDLVIVRSREKIIAEFGYILSQKPLSKIQEAFIGCITEYFK